MDIGKLQPKVESNRNQGAFQIAMVEWVTGDINGGGSEISFKTFNADILIRKRN